MDSLRCPQGAEEAKANVLGKTAEIHSVKLASHQFSEHASSLVMGREGRGQIWLKGCRSPICGHHLRPSFPPSAGPLCPSQTVGVLQSALRGHRRQQGPEAGGAPARSLPLQRPHCGRVQRRSSVMLFVRLSAEPLLPPRAFKAARLVATAAMHHRPALPVSPPSLLLWAFITGASSAISFNNR